MFGIAASAAGTPESISLDCTQRTGTDDARVEWIMREMSCESSGAADGVTCVYGIPRDLSCCSTLVWETRALFAYY